MRRVATHRVYQVNTGDWLSFPVLELDEAGNVVRIYPLAEEISHTEWLPGMIFVSPFFIERNIYYYIYVSKILVNSFSYILISCTLSFNNLFLLFNKS